MSAFVLTNNLLFFSTMGIPSLFLPLIPTAKLAVLRSLRRTLAVVPYFTTLPKKRMFMGGPVSTCHQVQTVFVWVFASDDFSPRVRFIGLRL